MPEIFSRREHNLRLGSAKRFKLSTTVLHVELVPSHFPSTDSTVALQQAIDHSVKEKTAASQTVPAFRSASIKLEKGDYAIGTIHVPKHAQVALFSKDRVRLLYIGRRNRPMFLLEDNSGLLLKEKLEIYYNTNNIREALNLMIKTTSNNSRVEIEKEVKIAFFSQKVE
jgi:hypothetical protein